MKDQDRHYHLECVSCKKKFKESDTYTSCLKCGDSLDVVYDYDRIAARLNKPVLMSSPLTTTKYLSFYPLNDLRKIISLHEGGTPLYRCKNLCKELGMDNIYLKNEGRNPTGAFKDRGTMVEITKAVEMGKKAIVCASTGNMAASVSAYAAQANIPCYIIVPEGTPIGKLSQTLSYGARIIQVRGSYDDAAALAVEISKKNDFFLAGDYAFRLEGQKSGGYEIIEQLGWKVPDKVIIPVGCGTNLSAVWKGFKEFHKLGFIDKLPQMVAVQAKGANPVVNAFNKKSKKWDVLTKPQTVASAMCVGDPLDGTKVLNAVYESKGLALDVSDEEILEAEKLLARAESIFVEPSAAATLAALVKLHGKGKIKKNELVVLYLTGAGLKDPLSALKVLPSPPSVEPVYDEVKKFLNYGYYKVHAGHISTNPILFKKLPTSQGLKKIIKQKFDLDISKKDLDEVLEGIEGFIEKGKEVTQSDLKLILKSVMKLSPYKIKALEVDDFEIVNGKHKRPKATIEVTYKGKKLQEKADGVGPVDAIINAIKKCVSNGFKFRLTDYHVQIDSNGPDAVVEVKMTLMDDKNNKVIAVGTSPDIIVASISAFEEAYNVLYVKNKGGKR